MEDTCYSPEYVKGLFNRMSSSYERMNFITSLGFSIRWRKRFLHPFKQSDEKVEIIDLLTGMGETWQATKNKLPHSNLTVLDFSEEMLKYAQQKSKEKYNDQVTVLYQDILQNQLPDNHYDFVTCAFGLKTFNTQQLQVLAQQTKRILKPGGQFSFIEVSRPDNKVLCAMYGLYLERIIPVLGRLLLGRPDEYKMLWKYISRFENAKAATAIFAETGLHTTFASYFYGCATGFHGNKSTEG